MERVTLRLPAADLDAIEALVDDGEYPNRSAAIRAGVATVLDKEYEPITPTRTPAAAREYMTGGGSE